MAKLANCNPFSYVVSVIFFTSFLIFVARDQVNSEDTASVSFSFDKFTPGDSSITLQGSAEILENGILALTNRTNPRWDTGRALYTTAVPIWDKTTGNAASFFTSLSLVVQDIPGFTPADGFIFFLAPPDTQIPNNSSGGKLGVVDPNNALNYFVGVELDILVNRWDPGFPHVGINVNSLISLKTVKWNRVSGSLIKLSVVYDSPSKTLSVLVTYEDGQISTVAQVVDLKAVLPETVRVGLSATTSGYRQLTDIHSWSFASTFGAGHSYNNHMIMAAGKK